jgi:hypothetical protein
MFQTIEKEKVTLLQLVPTMIIELMEHFDEGKKYGI